MKSRNSIFLIIVLVICASCTKKKPNYLILGKKSFEEENYSLARSQFSTIKSGELNYDEAQEYIRKTDSIEKVFLKKNILKDSIAEIESSKLEKKHETKNEPLTYKFVLTHLLGKKLIKDAYFYVGEKETWILDFRNGDIITYSILSMNENNPMCGITAKDTFGDTCDICITQTSGKKTKVEIKYGTKRLTYTGYFSEKIN